MTPYYLKLRDPRWQRRRTEIMQRANFACELCEGKQNTLNVHHKAYIRGRDPWDYADDELVCVCEPCHLLQHRAMDELSRRQAKLEPWELERLVGYAAAAGVVERRPGSVELWSYEVAWGVADALGLKPPHVISLADENKAVTNEALYSAWAAQRRDQHGRDE